MFGMDKLSSNRDVMRFEDTRRRTKVRRVAKFVYSKNAFIKRKHANFACFLRFVYYLQVCTNFICLYTRVFAVRAFFTSPLVLIVIVVIVAYSVEIVNCFNHAREVNENFNYREAKPDSCKDDSAYTA